MGVAYSCLKYGVLSRPDLMLYFVNNTVRAHGHEKHVFDYFAGVELFKDAGCFFGKLYCIRG